jgi:serine/threonine-protein phosphatase PP1 catalytic subunit
MHGGLSPDLQSMEQIRRVMRPTDVPDTGKAISIGDQNSCSNTWNSMLVHANCVFAMIFLKQDSCVTYCGLIQIRTSQVGVKMIEACRLRLARM